MASIPAPPTIPIPPTISNIAGPALIGVMLNWFLYGALVVQTYVYTQCFPNDTKKLKYLVYIVFALDTIQTALASADAYHWFAEGYGNMLALNDPFISPFDNPILDGILAFAVQVFFCWRIWVLQKSIWIPSLVLVAAVTSLAGALASGIMGFKLNSLAAMNELTVEFSLWCGGAALADTLIAVIMTYLLLRARSGSEYRKTDTVLVKIVRLTVETNAITASVAIVTLVCNLAVNGQNSSAAVAPGYVLGKLYSNTLMAVLNNRIYMTGRPMVQHTSLDRDTTRGTTGIMEFRGKPTRTETLGDHQLESKGAPEGTFRIGVLEETVTDVSYGGSRNEFEKTTMSKSSV
ncbi:hypothetical protein FPV67DRAFT_1780860 [Lyophyllum atratum]|nr:hypothetical protein FPV67DRAFT_1780860 [Lyophyllum atratum]